MIKSVILLTWFGIARNSVTEMMMLVLLAVLGIQLGLGVDVRDDFTVHGHNKKFCHISPATIYIEVSTRLYVIGAPGLTIALSWANSPQKILTQICAPILYTALPDWTLKPGL